MINNSQFFFLTPGFVEYSRSERVLDKPNGKRYNINYQADRHREKVVKTVQKTNYLFVVSGRPPIKPF